MKLNTKTNKKNNDKDKSVEKVMPLLTGGIMPVTAYFRDIDAFVLSTGELMSMFEIKAKDLFFGDPDMIQLDNAAFSRLFHTHKDDTKLIALNVPVNTASQAHYIEHLMERTENPVYLDLLDTRLYEEKYIASNVTDRKYILMYYARDKAHLAENAISITSSLNRGGAAGALVKRMSFQEQFAVLFKLFNMNTPVIPSSYGGSTASDIEAMKTQADAAEAKKEESLITTLKKKAGLFEENAENAKIDLRFIQEVAPRTGVSFRNERYNVFGDGYTACLYVYKYPKKVRMHWLSDIMTINDSVAVIDIRSQDIDIVKKNIARSMEEQKSRIKNAKNNAEAIAADYRLSELELMNEELSMMDDAMKQIVSRIYLYKSSVNELDEKVAAVRKELEGDSYNAAINLSEGKNDFRALVLPYHTQAKQAYKKKGQPLLASTLAAANPYNYVTLMDPFGTYWGNATNSGGVINFDMGHKTDVRLSYSAMVLGMPRSGKSTLLKKFIEDRSVRGDLIRIFDPTGEFERLIDHFGGKIISLDGTSGNIINALQILASDEDPSVSYNNHITKVMTIFGSLFPGAPEERAHIFEKLLRDLYIAWGFLGSDGTPKPDCADRPPNKYPIWSNLLKLVRKEVKRLEDADRDNSFEYIHMKPIEVGIDNLVSSYGNIFDGHTTIAELYTEQIVCFNAAKLKTMKSEVFDAQVFAALSLCWSSCLKTGQKMKDLYDNDAIAPEDVTHFWLLIDEAHHYVNANKLIGVGLLTIYMREAPKYYGGLILASHSLRDFVPDDNQTAGIQEISKLFEFTQYRFILHQSASTRKKYEQVFGGSFTDRELDRISELNVGETILSIEGDQNIEFKIVVPEDEMRMFAGGA
jgi:hypothetical protein